MAIEDLGNLDGYSIAKFKDERMLREHRILLGLTQQAAADRAGIPLQSYQQFESGKRKIRRASFQIACQVLEALEMDLAKFHHGDYSIGEPTFIKDGKTCFKATGKPVDEEPSGD